MQLFSPEMPQLKLKRDGFCATPIGNQPGDDITGEKIVPPIRIADLKNPVVVRMPDENVIKYIELQSINKVL